MFLDTKYAAVNQLDRISEEEQVWQPKCDRAHVWQQKLT